MSTSPSWLMMILPLEQFITMVPAGTQVAQRKKTEKSADDDSGGKEIAENDFGEWKCDKYILQPHQRKNKAHACLRPPESKNREEICLLTDERKKEQSKQSRKNVNKEKPDGGWGWMVVFGVAISNMSTQSLVSVFGLLFLQRLSELEISTQGASIMMSVQTTCLNLSGLVIGPVMRKFSYRKTASMGAAFVVTGLLLTLIANSLPAFVVTYSLFTGLGLGLLNPSTFVAVESYFSSRKGRAVGLALAGTGIGQMCLPLLIEYLLQHYGFHGTILILSGLALHSLLGATLYQPAKWHLKEKRKEKNEETASEDENNRTSQSTIECSEEIKPNVETNTKSDKEENKEESKGKYLRKFCADINIDLLKNPSFLLHLIDIALVYVANMCFSMLLPFFLESIEFSRARIALSMTTLAGADILGRLTIPIFTDLFKIRSKTSFFIGALLSAAARSSLALQSSYTGTIVFAGVCGYFRSAIVMNFNLSISEQVPTEKLPAALGLHMLFKGAGIMVFGYIIGFIRDYTKSFSLCIHILSVFFLGLPFCVWLIERIYIKRR